MTWTSGDTDIATVDNSGKVTGVAVGSTTITVTATNGTDDTDDDKTATCVITVLTDEEYYAAAYEVIGRIDALPETSAITTSDSHKTAVTDARNAYDALAEGQKTKVNNYDALVAAETRIADLEKAEEVISIINQIGTVEYTEDCKNKIDAAKEAYDALNENQKPLVTNYDKLMQTIYAR